MAVTATHLTTNSDGSAVASYATASITPTANNLVLVMVGARVGAGSSNVPTLTGNGLTYVEVTHLSLSLYTISVFRALGAAPSTGTITMDFGAQTQQECCWSVVQFGGVNTTGTNGSGAVVQSATNSGSGTTLSATLAAFGATLNATYGAFLQNNSAMTFTAGTGFTILGQDGGFAPGVTACSEWQAANDTSVDCTSTSGSGWEAIAVEIKAASGGLLFRGA